MIQLRNSSMRCGKKIQDVHRIAILCCYQIFVDGINNSPQLSQSPVSCHLLQLIMCMVVLRMFSRTDCVCSHVQTVYVHAYRLCMFTRTLQTVHVHATDCAAEPAPQPCLQRPDTHTGHELHPICMRRLGCCMRPSANALPSVKLLSVPTGQGRELLCFLDVGNAFRVLGYRMRAHTLLRLRVPTECCDLA